MHKARAFFVCAGLLCLALAYHLGARSAGAQAPGNPVAAAAGGFIVTANGDVYAAPGLVPPSLASQWVLAGNVFSGNPTPAAQPTWGQVKAKYATPAPGVKAKQ
jgi:hypothetical protein